MRASVLIACLLMMCCATPKPRGEYEALFNERARTAFQYEPYRTIDVQVRPEVPLEPQPDVVEVMRYTVPPEVSGSTASAPAPDPPAEPAPEPEPTYDEGPWRPYGY